MLEGRLALELEAAVKIDPGCAYMNMVWYRRLEQSPKQRLEEQSNRGK